MSAYRQNSVEQLYESLPEVYRNRDKIDDPARGDDRHLYNYLDAFGAILDLTRHTLEQRYDDSFPDTSVEGRRCQDWLLPYFGDFLAVNFHSPYPDGQREEVASAVRWAQRKGTLQTVEEVVEAITQSEGEIQEGWKRVATTARIGLPLLPATALGEAAAMAPDQGTDENATPQQVAKHPGLRAVTPDLRKMSRAIECDPGVPSSKATIFGWNGKVWPLDDMAIDGDEFDDAAVVTFWRQANPHGVPCFPGSYEDVSLRTVDVREIDGVVRPYHPKRAQIFLPPPFGICTPDPKQFAWSWDLDTPQINSTETEPPLLGDYVEKFELADGSILIANTSPHSIEIVGDINLDADRFVRFEKLRFRNDINMTDGSVELIRCAASRVIGTAPAEQHNASRRIRLRDCLIADISAPQNIVSTEYVTVLNSVTVRRLLASDSIFAGSVSGVNFDDCVRYTRVPPAYFEAMPPVATSEGVTTAIPEFYSGNFGEAGCGVLRQTASDRLKYGAEDGTEMGAHHAWRYIAQIDGLDAKLRDYLPVGVRPVISYDERLLCKPPISNQTES